MKFILLLTLTFIFQCVYTQVRDVVWSSEGDIIRSYVPYESIREADIAWSKRVWREIDVRQKMNLSLYYPLTPNEGKMSLFDAIKHGVVNGEMRVYSTGVMGDEDSFKDSLSISAFINLLEDTVIEVIETVRGDTEEVQVVHRITSADIAKIEIKEDWFFDRKRSVMDVRIIGICPKIEEYDEFGALTGYRKLFWIYFPHARYALSRYFVSRRFSDKPRTFEEIFSKRAFSSVIIKVSNPYDRYIGEYKSGLDALIEAQKLEEDFFEMEQGNWKD